MNLFVNRNKKFEDSIKNQIGDVEYKPSESSWEKIVSNLPEDDFEFSIADKVNSFHQNPENTNWEKIESKIPFKNFQNIKRIVWIPLLFIFFGSAAVLTFKTFLNTEKQNAVSIKIKSEKLNSLQDESFQKQKINAEKISSIQFLAKENIKPSSKIINYKNTRLLTNVGSKKIVATNNQNKNTSVSKSSIKPGVSKQIINSDKSIEKKNNFDESLSNSIEKEQTNNIENSISSYKINDVKSISQITNLPVKVSPFAPLNYSLLLIETTNDEKRINKSKYSEDELTRFSITAITGMQYCYNILTAPANSSINFTENIALRRKIELPAVDWNGGFLLDYEINDNWRISTGVSVSNFTQNFQYSITSPSANHQPISEPGATLSNPNDSILYGNAMGNRIKYTWTEIPLFITYSFNPKSKICFEIMTGISYGIISGVDAAFVSYDNVGLLVLTDKSNFPGIKNNLFFHVNPHVNYQISKLVSVGVCPTFKYSLTSITANDSWVQQQPYFIGISATLRRKF